MLFSNHFNVTRGPLDDWFDPILESDTELFIDPFLIFKDSAADWRAAHAVLIGHFDEMFKLLAKSGGRHDSPYYTKAWGLLLFPEPDEVCLGYTARSVKGAGGGKGLASDIARAMLAAIDRGIKNLDHFEVLGIFNRGIGPDRVGDLTSTILKPFFIRYTEKVVARHAIPTESHVLRNAGVTDGRWAKWSGQLPTNPNTGDPVVLVPRRFLRRLPTLAAENWWEWYGVKADLNIDIMEGADKETIVRYANMHRKDVAQFVKQSEKAPADPYDIDVDDDLVWQWEPQTHGYTAANPLDLASLKKQKKFHEVIDLVVQQYKHYIEKEGGWRLLYNEDGSERHEDASQNLFRGIAKHYCHANNIAIDREVNLGRGPVDFKFSRGSALSVHLEVKKLTSGGFWYGIESQLLDYMDSDETSYGWFLGIQLRDGGISKTRKRQLPATVARVADENGVNLKYALVDGQKKASASKKPARPGKQGKKAS